MAFQRCWATEIRWNRNAVSRGSPDIREALFPSSMRNSSPSSLMGPRVSMATGQKSWVGRRSSYFLIFSNAAASAAAPATNDVLAKWEFANVSEIVTSHVMHLPLPHGIKIIPSGRLWSSFNNPAGSFLHGILAFKSVRQIISLMASWRAVRHVLRRHAGPWLPLSSTRAPQMHVYGSQRPTPSRRPTATRMASLSKRRPQAVFGHAFSHSVILCFIILFL